MITTRASLRWSPYFIAAMGLTLPLGASAQMPPTRIPTTPNAPACGPADERVRERQANQLAASVHLARATESCDSEASEDCQVFTCLRAGLTVGGSELEAAASMRRALRVGLSASAANGTVNESVVVEDTRPLSEGVEAVASATALFESFTQGLAGFLINRARLEMQRAALERLRTNVCDPTANILTNTCGFLGGSSAVAGRDGADSGAGGASIANAAATFGAGLQTAFQRDVLGLPLWLLDHGGLNASTETVVAQRLALRLIAALLEQSDPGAVVSALLTESAQWTATGPLVANTVKALRAYRLIALAMGASAGAGTQVRISLGARAQVVQLLLRSGVGLEVDDRHLPQCMQIARSAWDAQRAAQDLGNPSLSDAQRRSRIATLAFNFVAALRATYGLVTEFGEPPANSAEFLRGLSTAIAVFESMATGDIARVYASMVGAFRQLSAGASLIPSAQRQALSWLAAGAEFAAARSPQQIEAAISAFAAPPGSWQSKLDQPGVWVNGFVGIGGGGELLFNGQASSRLGTFIAPQLSLGIDLTRPIGNRSWAIGLYIPMLDLGALANASSATLSSNSAAVMTSTLAARVSPGQFLAPGLYARLNLGRSPLVLAAGASVLPFGREVELVPNTGVFENAASVRFGATLSVDIPIVPLSF